MTDAHPSGDEHTIAPDHATRIYHLMIGVAAAVALVLVVVFAVVLPLMHRHSDDDRQFNQRRADCFAEHSGEPDAVRICMSQP